jgi:hypothetical protein
MQRLSENYSIDDTINIFENLCLKNPQCWLIKSNLGIFIIYLYFEVD